MNVHDPDLKDSSFDTRRPNKSEAEEAVRVLLRWAGEDPNREGLLDTPHRVTEAYAEWFKGYDEDPEEILSRVFDDVSGYDDIVLLKDIRFESYCEHHLAPIIGVAHVAYLPKDRVVGISKLARVVEAFSKRMQVQEKLTAQIADTIASVLRPRGVAVVLEGEHHCMSTRGVHKHDVSMVTRRFLGAFEEDQGLRRDFLEMIKKS